MRSEAIRQGGSPVTEEMAGSHRLLPFLLLYSGTIMGPVTTDSVLYFLPRFKGKCGRCGTVAQVAAGKTEQNFGSCVKYWREFLWCFPSGYLPVVSSVTSAVREPVDRNFNKMMFWWGFLFPVGNFSNFMDFFHGPQILFNISPCIFKIM